MVENDRHAQFRESISQASEFTQPFIAKTPFGTQIWPFKEVESKRESFSNEKIVFEASSPEPTNAREMEEDLDPMLMRVSYEEPYGLTVKRRMVLRNFPNTDEFKMQSGEIIYSFGEIDIRMAAKIDSPIMLNEGFASNPENFKPTISVVAGDKPVPPLAYVEYHSSSRIPINVEFSCADFKEALGGDVEKREKHGYNRASYKKTYFQWEELAGAKVGIARYDNPNYPDQLEYYRWVTAINNPKFNALEGSPYAEKISWRVNWREWGSGRLRFLRKNSQTGELWMLSVPEWIDKKEFYDDIQHKPLENFFSKYPIRFWVNKPGEEKKWFSTFWNKDRVR